MTKTKSTKRALLSSVLALVVCIAMLVGSTFAWFTDNASTGCNIIQSGKLDIVLEYWNGSEWADAEGQTLNFRKAAGAESETVLWEPGCTYELPKIRVRNAGNLAANVLIKLGGITGDEKLMEAIELKTKVSNVPASLLSGSQASIYNKFNNATVDVLYRTPDGTVIFDWSLMGKGIVSPNSGHTDTSAEFTICGHMKEEAGNEYQNLKIDGISIIAIASQQVFEYDSNGRDYDTNAKFPALTNTLVPDNRTESTPIKAGNVTVDIPADAPAGAYSLTVDNTFVTVDENGNSVANFEINLTRDGKSVNSDGKEYTVTLFVAKGINPDTTKLYHKGVDITSKMIGANPVEGTVTFKTDSFSPFSVKYTIGCDLYQDGKTFYVFNADGFEQLNKKMLDKSAGQGAVVKLCANIDMTGKTWTPVDSHADTAFYLSEFDGQDYTISNLTINGQAMFQRFAGFGDVVIKDVLFYNATVNSTSLNTSILTVQTYQNLLLDNVDVKKSSITGTYKVAPLIGSVYNESSSSITATLKDCDVSDTVVTATQYDFCTCGMVSFVYTTDNDYVEYENCTVTNVQLRAVSGGYNYHANIHYTSADTDDQINEHPGVKVTNVTFEKIS